MTIPDSSLQKHNDRYFHLVIPADLGELAAARQLMQEVGEVAQLEDQRVFNLQVVVSEAAANAIEHAASEVNIAAWVLLDRIIVEITNDGVFLPGLSRGDEHRRRGLGLPLMVSLADQVHVARLANGKTRVSLTFFLGVEVSSDGDHLSESANAAVRQLAAETMKLRLMTSRAEALSLERGRLYEETRQRVEELERMMAVVPVAIWVAHDPRCSTIVGNLAANELYKTEPNENVSAGPVDGEQDTTRRFFKDGIELMPHQLPMQQAAARDIDIRDSEVQVLLPSGVAMTLLGNASPLKDREGRVRGCVAAFIDITERKRAEDELNAINEDLLRLNRAMVGRELRMIDLKREVNALRAELGRPPRYPVDIEENQP